MSDSVYLRRSATQALILGHERSAAVMSFLGFAGWVGLSTIAIFYVAEQFTDTWVRYLKIGFVPLLGLVLLSALWNLFWVLRGRIYTFDPVQREIWENETLLGTFDQVDRVDIYKSSYDGDSEGKDQYAVRLLFRDQRRVALAQIHNRFELVYIAEEIAKVLGVAVQGKPPGTFVAQEQPGSPLGFTQ